jgi:hypothetical protein
VAKQSQKKNLPRLLGDVDKAGEMGCTASEIRCHSSAMKYAPATYRNHSPANRYLFFCGNIKEHARHLNYGAMTIRFCFVAGDNS